MCKGSSNTTTTVQNPQVPDWLSNAFQSVVGQAQATAQLPFNPGTLRNVAGFSGDQMAAFDAVRDNQGIWQPALNTAQQFATSAGQPISGQQIANYSNPFQQQVIDATLANIQQNNQIQANNLRGNAALQGALGNDRVGVAQAELARQQNLATNQILANLNAANYNQALGAAQMDRTAANSAAGTLGALGNQVSGLAANDAARLLTTGGLQQQLGQQMLDTASGNAQLMSQFPFANTQWLAGILTGAGPSFTGYSQTQTQPGPSPLNSILGLGATALGAFLSDARVKSDISPPIGETYDGVPIRSFRFRGDGEPRVGVIAQEVEQINPDAVVEGPAGLKMVDYRALGLGALAGRPGFAFGGEASGGSGFTTNGLTISFGGRRAPQQNPNVNPNLPYGSRASLSTADASILAAQTPHFNPPHPAPRPEQSPSEAFRMARDAVRMGKEMKSGLGDLVGKIDTTAGAGGFTTSVRPEGAGLGNYIGNLLSGLGGMAYGGRVRRGYAEGGDVFGGDEASKKGASSIPVVNPYDLAQQIYGNVPGWIVSGLAASNPPPVNTGDDVWFLNQWYSPEEIDRIKALSQKQAKAEFGKGALSDWKALVAGTYDATPTLPKPAPLQLSNIGSGLSAEKLGGLLPQGAAFNPLSGNFGSLVDTNSLLNGGQTVTPGFGNVATGLLPIPQPQQPQPGQNPADQQQGLAYGGRVRKGYEGGGDVYQPEQPIGPTPGAGLGAAYAPPPAQPAMQPQAQPQQPQGLFSGLGGLGQGLSGWAERTAGNPLAMALIRGGLATLGSRSPHPTVAVGEGANAAFADYYRELERRAAQKRADDMLKLHYAQLAEQKRYHDAQMKKLEQGAAARYGLNPIYGTDAEGNTVLLQPSTTGEAVQTKLPPGVKVSTGVEKIDAGTHWVLQDKRSGQTIGTIPKELEAAEQQKARGEAVGKAEGQAQVDLPRVLANANMIIRQIEEIENDPNLSNVTGWEARLPTLMSRNVDTEERINQALGGAFLQAYESLKGGGQITEVEGAKATAAKARLANLKQSDAGFREALADFKREVLALVDLAKRKAARTGEPAPAPVVRRRFNPETGNIE